ncbi:hypothetical protein [Haloarcula montana]|uniref:hypothetical protein n=1 Tax=Haloarcula montana TaxID=3111776 RepID=UPI002D7A3253|nr:hypothetical protein [Haloarcula sp. GH36]
MPYEPHPSVTTPEDHEAKIWRYMGLSQFMSLVERESLFFNRSDKFEDPFEGEYPPANFENRDEIVSETKKRGEKLEELTSYWSPGLTQAVVDSVKSGPVLDDFEYSREMFFLNCWHMNEYESAAMWDVYSDSDAGIAVQSTVRSMISAFEKSDYLVRIGEVKYIDYQDTSIPEDNMYHRFLHKRKSFEHEKELRAIIDDLPTTGEVEYDEEVQAPARRINWDDLDDGKYVSVDIESLIETIYLSPTSPGWMKDLLQSICSSYNLDFEVIQSDLYDDPVR